jgi:glycosyltransferase involved in cell wall biosynthesis
MLIRTLALPSNRIRLFPENGVEESFFYRKSDEAGSQSQVHLLFVGRLVAYNGADMLLEAVAQIDSEVRKQMQLTIVGDGPERENLALRIKSLDLEQSVTLTGWVAQDQTAYFYRQADIFCFPSIREFGGAVVLEAMAHSLPCIVVDNGGIAEYVTEDCGFKVEPRSREFIIQAFGREITRLVIDRALRTRLGEGAFERGRSFSWQAKAQQVVDMYREFCP